MSPNRALVTSAQETVPRPCRARAPARGPAASRGCRGGRRGRGRQRHERRHAGEPARCERLVAAVEAAQARGEGAVLFEGRLLDEAMTAARDDAEAHLRRRGVRAPAPDSALTLR